MKFTSFRVPFQWIHFDSKQYNQLFMGGFIPKPFSSFRYTVTETAKELMSAFPSPT